MTILGDRGDEVVFVASGVTTDREAGFGLYEVGFVTLRVAEAVNVTVVAE